MSRLPRALSVPVSLLFPLVVFTINFVFRGLPQLGLVIGELHIELVIITMALECCHFIVQ